MSMTMGEFKLAVYMLKKAFSKAFVNGNLEMIVEPTANQYFILEDCKGEKDVRAKMLEWLSRGACKTMPYQGDKQNKIFREYMQTGINTYLDTDFSQEDFEKIYDRLGNCINHELTLKFIDSCYDMDVLKRQERISMGEEAEYFEDLFIDDYLDVDFDDEEEGEA